MTITSNFREEKKTKNTIKFIEETEPGEIPKIGTIYVPKTTLARLGYADGLDLLKVSLSVNSE